MVFKKKKSFYDTTSMQNMKHFDKKKYFAPPLYNISPALSLTASSLVPREQPRPFDQRLAYYQMTHPQQQTYYPQIVQPRPQIIVRPQQSPPIEFEPPIKQPEPSKEKEDDGFILVGRTKYK
jgi:hypothetical protein